MAKPSEAEARVGRASYGFGINADNGDGVLRDCIWVALHPFPKDAFELIADGINISEASLLPLRRVLPVYRMLAIVRNEGRKRDCCGQQETGKQVVHSEKFKQGEVGTNSQDA